jgi:hypothetical protein
VIISNSKIGIFPYEFDIMHRSFSSTNEDLLGAVLQSLHITLLPFWSIGMGADDPHGQCLELWEAQFERVAKRIF